MPTPTGNAAQDAVYEGWLYAAVATPAGAFDGLFVTKDFGQNWTQVRIPTVPNQGYQTNQAIPTNDVSQPDFPIIGGHPVPAGQLRPSPWPSIPTNPNIVYLGGTADGNQTGLIRIDLTDIWDAHSLVAYLRQRQRRRSAEPGLHRPGHDRPIDQPSRHPVRTSIPART